MITYYKQEKLANLDCSQDPQQFLIKEVLISDFDTKTTSIVVVDFNLSSET